MSRGPVWDSGAEHRDDALVGIIFGLSRGPPRAAAGSSVILGHVDVAQRLFAMRLCPIHA